MKPNVSTSRSFVVARCPGVLPVRLAAVIGLLSYLALATSFSVAIHPAFAQSARSVPRGGLLYKTALPADSQSHPEAAQATTTLAVLKFDPALLNAPAANAQTLTATFTVSGYSGSFTPIATMHYGHDYTLGAVSCTPSGSTETCSVDVTFQPTLPGGRRDAIFLSDGTNRLATLLVYGIGQVPFAAVQPGVVTSLTIVGGNTGFYNYNTAIDENGTIYVATNDQDSVYQVTKDGTVTRISLPGIGFIDTLAIDGAGVLYLSSYTDNVVIYDTVLGTQGKIAVAGTSSFIEDVAIDGVGDVFALQQLGNGGTIFEKKPDGSVTSTAISPAVAPEVSTTDADGNLYWSYQQINELTAGGVQTQISTVGATEGIAIDAAGILYVTRNSTTGGVAELLPGAYSTPTGPLDSGSPLGLGLASDGTLAVGNYNVVDVVDRTRGSLDFGQQTIGVSSSAQSTQILNIGNKPLTISTVSLSGDGYALATSAGDCVSAIVLAPAESCSVSLTSTPSHAGSSTGTLTITSNSLYGTTTQTTMLTNNVYGAYVTAAPSPLSFANQVINTASDATTVTLSNQGNYYDAAIGTPTSTDPAFAAVLGTCATNVAVGSSCAMTVTFTPTSATHYSATISVPVKSAGAYPPLSSTTSFTVTGDGIEPPAPVATLTPATIAFGNQSQNTSSAAQTATLSNTGNAALTITAVSISGANPADFSETNNCGTSLAAGSSCTITTTFLPLTTGALSATLGVSDNAAGASQTASLTGTGTAPPAPVPSFSPASLAFGSVSQGSASSSQMVTLSNTGNAALTVTGISISGSADFSQTNTCGASVAAGDMCTVTVVYKPQTLGAETATLTLSSNATGTAPSVALTGTGTVPPAPVVTLAPSVLAFGNQTQATSSTAQTITVANTGNAPLTGIAIQLSEGAMSAALPSSTADYAATTTCTASLSAGATCTIGVTFAPTATGSLPATISISDNASGSPQAITLTGTGTEPPQGEFTLSATPPTLTVNKGVTAQFNLIIGTTGGSFSSPVTLAATGLPEGATATFAPASVTPGTGSVASVLTIQTSGSAALKEHQMPWWKLGSSALAFALLLVPGRLRRQWRGRITLGIFLLLTLGATASITGCGSTAPPKNYTITITGTSGSDIHSTTVQLTVNQ